MVLSFNDVRTPGSCPAEYSLTRTWTAVDNCGNTATASQTILVKDTTAPVISGVGGPETIECPATPVFSTPTASDLCDTNPVLSFNDVRTPGSCPAEYSLTRTWTATDACGNSSSASQTITVEDTTAPVITGVGGPLTIECPASPVFSTPTAFDPCDPNVVLSFNDVRTPGSCPAEYSLTRTWTATDACGNSSSASQTILVKDTTAPVITGVGGPETIECPANPVFSEPTAFDPCDPNVVLSFNDVRTPGSCPAEYSLTRTWTAIDDCGNTATASQTILVKDTTAPVISGVGGPETIECPANPVFSTPTASDLCDTNPVLSFNDVRTPGSCPAEYVLTRTWTATDACGNSSSASQAITVEDTTAPIITGVGGPATIECPASPVFSTPTASDLCDTNPVLSFNDVRTPGSCPAEYVLTRTWTATDACGNSSSASQAITVEDTTAPVITGVGGPLTIECPATPVFSTPTAFDPCDPNVVLSFNDVTTPGSCPAEYSLTRTWTAVDCAGNSITASQTITVEDTTAPVISGVGANATIECPATPVFSTPTAFDPCDPNVALSFNDVTTPGSCPAEYSLTRTWTAVDCAGNSITASQTITVEDTTAPVISGVGANATIECPATPVFSTPTAFDPCDPNVVLSFNDVTTPGSCPAEYSLTRTWSAVDCAGNSITASQTITVEDTTAPVISGVGGPLTIECPATPVFSTPTAFDPCDPNVVLSFNDVTTPGSCPAEYSLTRTWTAVDCAGNSITASQTITVEDTTAPVISGVGANATIECPATPVFSTPTAFDPCDPNVALSFNDVTTPGSCPAEYSLTRTWTAVDCAGNSITASQTITVEDTTAPVISGVGANATIECPATPVFSNPTALDACEGAVTPSYVDVTTASPCPNEYSVTRTWTAVDCAGNSITASQTITVEDNTPPVIVCPPDIIAGECEATVTFEASVSDLCDSSPTLVAVPPSGSIFPVGVTNVVLTATDACGNTSTCTFKVTVTEVPTGIIAGPSAICQGQSTELCGPDGDFGYSWSGPGGLTATTKCITATLAGTYELVLTDNTTDCVGVTILHELTVNPLPSCAIEATEIACDHATLCAPEGDFMYLWTGPNGFLSTDRCITVTATGDYHLALTDRVTGCETSCMRHFDRTPCFENCPRTVGFWAAQVSSGTLPAMKYSSAQLNAILTCIDAKSQVFFPGNGTILQKFTALITNNKPDQRTQAKRQYLALLANICAGELQLTPPNGDRIFLDLATPIACNGLGSTTLGALVMEVEDALLTLESLPIRNAAVKQEYSEIILCLDGVNNGRIADSACPMGSQAISALDSHSREGGLVQDLGEAGGDDASSTDAESVGASVELYRPWPNPFTSSSRIAYYVSGEGERTQIGVYDAAGRRIRNLVSGVQSIGRHEVVWDGTADDGSRVQHGVYFVRIVVGGVQRNMRLIYLQ